MIPYYDESGVTIYNGEALEVLRDLPNGCADVMFTDPPYSSGGAFRGDRAVDPASKYRGFSHSPDETRAPAAEYGTFGGDNRDQRIWAEWVTLWSFHAMRCIRPNGHAFCFTDWRQLPATTDALQLGGWTWQGLCVWDKGVGRPMVGRFRNHLEYVVWATHGALTDRSEHYPSTLISVPTVSPGRRRHVTQKPEQLITALLQVVPQSGTVLDPFMGAGSMLVSAKALGMSAIGIEIEERYCEIAATRLAQEVLDLGA